jgi:pimeloyl-ACP methyl ester carboxylesterase
VLTFVLIPGAGGEAVYWSRVVPLLERAGHEAIAVGLPGPDPAAGLPAYAEVVVAAAGARSKVVLIAQSLGGFTAPMAAERLPVHEIVLVNAMVPLPGETPGEWWEATGAVEERELAARAGGYGEFDLTSYFFHDVDEEGRRGGEQQESEAVFGTPCAYDAWRWPTRVLAGADDRFFPPAFQARVARERLGTAVTLRPGGHLIALSRPAAVAAFLLEGAPP